MRIAIPNETGGLAFRGMVVAPPRLSMTASEQSAYVASSSVPPVELTPGLVINDHVRLVRQIGEAGMGSLWLAEPLGLDAHVAVKFMAPALASHPQAVERFVREATSAARIHHPNVV